MPLPDISIRQLEYLVAAVDSSTWAEAAATVGVSASALSQGLAELERRLGVELFETVGRRRVFRPNATPVMEHARQVLALTGDVTDWAARIRESRIGRVRVGMIDVAAVVHFPEVLRIFRTELPDVDLMLSVASSRTLLHEVQAGHLDLAVCVQAVEPVAGVDTVALFDEPMIVYGPPGVSIAGPATWGPWVLFPPDSHTRRLVTDRLAELGAPIEVAAESHQPDVLREMVLLGLGWTVLPRSQGESERGDLAIGSEIVDRRLVLARRAASVNDPAADELSSRLIAASPHAHADA